MNFREKDLHIETDDVIIDKQRGQIEDSGSLQNEFVEKITDMLLHGLSPEHRERIGSDSADLVYLNPINLLYINPINKTRETETDDLIISFVVRDQEVALLHDRRTEMNYSEVTSVIFKKIIEQERKILLELLGV